MKKINKSTARKLYSQKNSFIIVPCKCSPTSIFALEIKPGWTFRNFDVFYNEFQFYNCNPETGKYPSFWVKED